MYAIGSMKFVKRLVQGLTVLIVGCWLTLTAWAYWPVADEIPAIALASSEDRFAEVDGLKLRYREWGTRRSDESSLLLIHGFGNSLQSFRELGPLLGETRHVVAVDMIGYGLSDKPVDFDYHNGPQADFLIRAKSALALEHVVYLGHSLGGAVALQAAIKDPRTRGLILINPGIISTGVPKIVQVTLPPLPRVSARLFANREFRSRSLKGSYANPERVTEAVIDDVMLASKTVGYMTGTTSLMMQYREGEELALAPQIDVPTLIPWGAKDRNKPPDEADRLQSLIAGSKLIRFANAGHYAHEEAAKEVAGAITLWLQALDL